MQFFSILTIFLGVTWATPIPDIQADSNPITTNLQFTSQQLGLLITELTNYSGKDPSRSEQMMRHAQETFRSLESVLEPLRLQKGAFDWTTTFSLEATLLSMDGQIHQLASTLKTKKDVIDKDRMIPVVFTMLKETQIGATELCDKIVANLPPLFSGATALFASEIKSVLQDILKQYTPPADITIISADQNRPFSGGFHIQTSPSANGPYPATEAPFQPQQQGPFQPPQQGPRPPQPQGPFQPPQQGPFQPQPQGPRPSQPQGPFQPPQQGPFQPQQQQQQGSLPPRPLPPQQQGPAPPKQPYPATPVGPPQGGPEQGGQAPPNWYRPNPNQPNDQNRDNNQSPPPGYSWFKGNLD